ncbi:inactive tyrosine-protein kinase 7-like [Centruroides vittatus]|uniref:inactive tyrosine-protein kinase 7-like n=1 Tax=Centruroides vittatus TaxID=120091 RepID=UPI00351013BA
MGNAWKFIVTWILAGVAAQDTFYFSPQPRDLEVIKGHSATLECGVSNNKHITFYWMLEDEKVQNTTRRFQQGSNLHITRVDPQHDLGEFKCIATNISTGISLVSQAAQINIQWISDVAKVNLLPQQSKLQEGGELVLQCKVDGYPAVHVEWYQNGHRLFRNEYVTLRSKRLHISPLRLHDNGIYSCRAVNEIGSVESNENYPLVLESSEVPKIVKLPRDEIVPVNGSARFDCVYENAATVTWFAHKTKFSLLNDSRITVYKNGSLLIFPVQDTDEGFYHCIGESASKTGLVQTYSARLQLAFLEAINENNFEPRPTIDMMMIAPKNYQFEVMCLPPLARPNPKVWWKDPSGRVVSDSGKVRVDDLRLIIDAVNENDAGNYTCIAENAAGMTENSIQLFITVPPSINSESTILLIGEGEPAVLLCDFTSSPYPATTVHWLKDKKYVRTSGTNFIFSPQNGTLYIKNVQLNDAGSYVCRVNTTGFPPIQSESITLNVKEKLKFVPPPVNKKLELNSNAKIYCKARATTPPKVKWIKEGGPLYFKWPPHIRDDNGTLHFNAVKAEDSGRYMCVATSAQDIINTTIQVDVIVLPQFVVKPADTEAYEGYSAMIHCMASGDPLPTIQWDKNNILSGFDPNRFAVMKNGTLFVSEVHMNDQGKYGCTAGNSGGFKRAEISFVVKSSEDYVTDHVGQSDHDAESNTMTKTVMITLGAAAIYMTLVIGLMIWCRFRRARRKAFLLAQTSAEVAKLEDGEIPNNTEMKEKTRNGDIGDGHCKSDGEMQSHSSGSHHSKRSRCSYDKLLFPQQDLEMMMLLGRGEYGEVCLSKARGIVDGDAETVVMVKMLQTKDENAHFEYKREMEMLHKLNHSNIAKLLGICRESDPFMMILEYSDWGDLKQFLLATRKDHSTNGPKPSPPSTADMIGLCHQAAIGMENLSNRRFTHKDLAARNCLISSKFHLKISCVGLSQDTYAQEYYLFRNRSIPLRWAPAEAILEDEWSTKSDVWSYAVLVWEIFNQAELPFSELSDNKVFQLIKKQQLQWQTPNGAPEPLCYLLNQCWNQSPKDRPSFSEIVLHIENHIMDSKV